MSVLLLLRYGNIYGPLCSYWSIPYKMTIFYVGFKLVTPIVFLVCWNRWGHHDHRHVRVYASSAVDDVLHASVAFVCSPRWTGYIPNPACNRLELKPVCYPTLLFFFGPFQAEQIWIIHNVHLSDRARLQLLLARSYWQRLLVKRDRIYYLNDGCTIFPFSIVSSY